jgi:predicted small integral membrane protein
MLADILDHRGVKMLAVRIAKIGCVAAVSFYVFLVALDNVLDYGTNFGFVTHVLDMDQVFAGSTLRWRAITSPIAHHASYILIIATEFAIAALSGLGALAMIRRLRADPKTFQSAKTSAVLGLALGFLLYEGGFIAVGGEWFGMWEAQAYNAVESAFRVAMTMLAVLIFVCLRDEEVA